MLPLLLLLSLLVSRPLVFAARTTSVPVDRILVGAGAAGGGKDTNIYVRCYYRGS